MNTVTLQPTSRDVWLAMRVADVTSTEISALFGCSPYSTDFELWHRKKNAEVIELDPNERMRWGTRLETSIAHGVAEDNGWVVSPKREYIRDVDLRLGASFDFTVIGPDTDGPGIMEVKNVDGLVFRDGWLVTDDGVEAPPHIELQVQQQLMLTGSKWAVIAALIGGNRVELIHRKPDLTIHEAIRIKAREFWRSIEANEPPKPDFARDAAVIAKLYGYANPGSVLDAKDNEQISALCRDYHLASEDEKEAKERKDAAKGELLTLIGDAEKVIANGFTISAGMIGPARIEYDRAGYRGWRVTPKRAK